MAVEQICFSVSADAASDLSAKQFYAVKLDTTTAGSKISLATAAKNCDGFLQDKPTSGRAGQIAVLGISKVAITASTAITSGQLLEVDTNSTLKGVASGTVVAKALEPLDSTAAVCIITALILKSAAAYT